MTLRQFAGKLLRSAPYLIYRATGLFTLKAATDSPPPSENFGEGKKILAIRLDAIGDFLMTTPALRSLRKRFPHAQLDILIQPGVTPLANNFPAVDRVESLRCNFLLRGGGRISGVIDWLSKLRELRRRNYDLVVDFTGLFHSAAVARATGAQVRIGFRRPASMGFFTSKNFDNWYSHVVDPDKIFHIADQMLLLPKALGSEPDSGGWEPIPVSGSDHTAENALAAAGIGPADGPLVLLHPGGKWPPKRWSTENFSKVIDILQGKGIRAAVMGGPGDESAIEAIRQKCRLEPIFFWPAGPIETIWGILKLADAFIGNDSGPMHMAAAAGTPIVALFGPTHPERCGARGSETVHFYADLECSPCPLYFSKNLCHRGHNYCMDNFDPIDVADAVSNLIKDAGLPRRIRQASPAPEPQ